MSGPAGFHPGGRYDFHLDLNGDNVADITIRATFGEAAAGPQDFELRLLAASGTAGGRGKPLASGRTEAVTTGSRGIRAWAGRAGDPFYINGDVVAQVTRAVQAGAPLDLRALAGAPPVNLFSGTNVNAIVVEFPDGFLPRAQRWPGLFRRRHGRHAGGQHGRVGFWATTSVHDGGAWHRVQRCGAPLFTTIFFASDSDAAAAHQATDPAEDLDRYGVLVSDLAAQVAGRLGVVGAPRAHGEAVRDQVLPDVLWYRPGTQASFTFAARNGRGLLDPAAEVVFSLVTGRAVPLGIGPDSAAGPLPGSFPYLPAPVAEPAVMEA